MREKQLMAQMDLATALRGPATVEMDEAKVQRHAAWYFGREGAEEPGGFVRFLLEAIAHADVENKARLALAFPAYVEAMRIEATR